MKTYNVALDITRMMAILSQTKEEFAEAAGFSRITIENILDNKVNVSKDILEKIYSYAYKRGINLNRSKELLFKDNEGNSKLLLHGARGEIVGDIDTKHSIPPNDFGDGFYVGETLSQSTSWVARHNNSSIYCFYLNDYKSLKTLHFKTDIDWLYVVLYYRNAFQGFAIPENILSLIGKVENCDLVIAPIANNETFKTIDSFARNEITDEACLHALSATNLGMQYVFKSEKACQRLKFIDRLYLCQKEKETYIVEKGKLSSEGVEKSRLALIEYRRKGKYFDELFKRKR